MKKILAFAVPILVCLLLGYFAGLIQADSIREWYPTLRKPPLTPPNIVFPIAWGILYLCMGISAGLIYLSSAPQRDFLIRLFCVQLFSNFIWSYLFFYLRNPLLGMIDILTLDIFVIYYLIKSYPVSKTASRPVRSLCAVGTVRHLPERLHHAYQLAVRAQISRRRRVGDAGYLLFIERLTGRD